MKKMIPALLLTLAACAVPAPSSGEDRPIARVVSGQQTSSQQLQRLREQGVAEAPVTPTEGSATPEVDPTKRFEYVDVTVSMGDPTGMKELVPYLMKPETWTLIKCEMLSTTEKHYRFQKVTSNDGRTLPDVDVFKTRR